MPSPWQLNLYPWHSQHHDHGEPVDLAALVAGKDELVDQLRFDKYEHLAEKYGFTLLCGRGSFTAEDRFVCDGEVVTAGQFLVATRMSPAVPPIPGLAKAGYLTSTTGFKLRELPSSLVVIGANAIALEVGQLFLELGTSVTFLEEASRIPPPDDPEISATLTEVLRAQGAEVHTSATVTGVESRGMRRVVTLSVGGSEVRDETDHVLVATGQLPNTAGLGLEAARVGLGAGSHGRRVLRDIEPEDLDGGGRDRGTAVRLRGRRSGCARRRQRHRQARQDARLVGTAEGHLHDSPDRLGRAHRGGGDPSGPSCRNEGPHPRRRARALVERDTAGLCKLVVEEGIGKVIGVHLLARGTGEVILAITYAIKAKMTVTQLAET